MARILGKGVGSDVGDDLTGVSVAPANSAGGEGRKGSSRCIVAQSGFKIHVKFSHDPSHRCTSPSRCRHSSTVATSRP